jgi:hypothetical protein
MNQSTTSRIPVAEGGPGDAANRPDGAPALVRGNADPGPNPRQRRRRMPRPAPTPCIDCTGAGAVAEPFETILSHEPLDIAVLGAGAASRVWLAVTIDCATGAVVDARLDLRR